MPDKPSKNEDEYFARRDAELLSETREHQRIAQDEVERRAHYMKCPKTGHDWSPSCSMESRSIPARNAAACGSTPVSWELCSSMRNRG
jgi:hypothetical protein